MHWKGLAAGISSVRDQLVLLLETLSPPGLHIHEIINADEVAAADHNWFTLLWAGLGIPGRPPEADQW